jgi:glycosyltransferase involved in cell wall biosynthesis
MKKIAIFLPNLKGGGAEKVALLLSNEFVSQGFNVDILLTNADGELLAALDKRINVIDLKCSRLRNAFYPLLRYLKVEHPDALLAFMWPLTLLAVTAFKCAKLSGRVMTSDHTTFSQAPLLKNNLIRKFFRSSLPLIYPFADARLAVSNGVADDLANLGRIKRDSIVVINNPVAASSTLFTTQKSQAVWQGFKGKKIVAVGALKWAKNYPLLLQAFAKLLEKENAMLTIVGQGELLIELENLTKELGIHKFVQFVGFSETPLSWMESSDLLVLSSHYEGFGNVIVEAMSVGTPVISTDCKSGPREILCDGKYGKLVPVGDVDALAQAMLQSLQEEHDIESLKMRAADFSVDKIAAQYLDIIFPKRLLKNN